MKIIFKIAKNEFRFLFYSPIAWFVMIVFLVQCAIFYTPTIFGIANWQEVLMKLTPTFEGFGNSLTSSVFLKSGIFLNVVRNLYLFVPILTMGLISREVNTGAIALLYSSPVRLRNIILGKYLGIMLYNLLLVGIVALFMVSGFFSIRHADYGIFFSAALGFYLLVCAYSAIGLLMSSLSAYQVVSAICTFAIIFTLSYIGGLWQRYDLVRDLTYFLSLQNRTGKMLTGLITTKDVIYFIVITGMFVCFTLLKLQNNRRTSPWYTKAGRYVAVMAAALLIGYISSRPSLTGYWDVTATNIHTIHPRTQQALQQLGDSTLEVTLYTNLLGAGIDRGMPEMRNEDYLATLWERYLRFRPDIRFRYVYYYDNDSIADNRSLYQQYPGKTLKQIATENADARDISITAFKTPEEMHQQIDLRPESYRLVMQLKYKGKSVFLRTFDDPTFWPDETNVNAALQKLLQPALPKVAAVTGDLERSIYKTGEREYAFHSAYKGGRGTLVNTGFEVDTVNLATHDIPADVTTLLLADPKTALSPEVSEKLKTYIGNGGNMLVMSEPGKQALLRPLLSQVGVQLSEGQLVRPTYNETPDKVISYLLPACHHLSEGLDSMMGHDPDDTLKILMPGTTTLSADSNSLFTITPLASTLPNQTWLKAGALVTDSTLPPFNYAEGDRKSSTYTTVLQLSRQVHGKEQRIIVCGDADFASNVRVATNVTLVMPAYSWLAYNRSPVYTPRPRPKDDIMAIGTSGAEAQRIAYLWVLPGLLLLSSTILLIRRKRK